jgi:hypothetical protein
MKELKVFGLGFHRTGTTSLQTALEELGYRVIGMRESEWHAFEKGDDKLIWQAVNQYDGFRDMPWPLMYEWLDANIKNARFVLTYRDPESWARSCSNFYKDRPHPMFKTIYGFDSFAGNEEIAIRRYQSHLDSVRAYFADRDEKLLEVNWEAGDGWRELCSFLDERIPNRTFPTANKGAYSLSAKVVRKMTYVFFRSYYFKKTRDK